MKVKFNIQKRMQIKNVGFHAIMSRNVGWWFNETLKIWQYNPSMKVNNLSSYQSCSSVKSFRRKLKKMPNETTFILWNRCVGYNVFGKGNFKNTTQ